MESLLKLYEDGVMMVKLNSILQKVDIDDMNSFNLMLLNLNKNLLSTHESLPKKQEDDLDRQIKFAQDKFLEFKVK